MRRPAMRQWVAVTMFIFMELIVCTPVYDDFHMHGFTWKVAIKLVVVVLITGFFGTGLWQLIKEKTSQESEEPQEELNDEKFTPEDASLTNFIQLSKQYQAEKMRTLRLTIALQGLVNKLEKIEQDEGFNQLFTSAQLAGMKYNGPTWGLEMGIARDVLNH